MVKYILKWIGIVMDTWFEDIDKGSV